MGGRFSFDELLSKIDGVINGNSETDARRRTGIRRDHRIDADKLALGIDKSTARVARVDRGIGLNHVRIDNRLARR